MNAFASFPRAQPFHLLCTPPPGDGKKGSLIQDSLLQEGSEWVFSEGDLIRSTSPMASLRSSQSSPSEIGGDSGVCSEHDTPPPSNRKQLVKRSVLSSDSDNDSSSSSPEVTLHEFIQAPPEPAPPLSPSVTIERSGSNSSSSSRGDGGGGGSRAKNSTRKRVTSCRVIAAQSKQLPNSLLREIKEKSRELKKRRQAMKGSMRNDERNNIPKTSSTSSSTCSSSRQKIGGRVSRLHSHFQSLTQDVSSLSLTDSANYSSMTSAPTEDDDYFPSHGNDYCKKHLFECRDETAGSGFAGFNNIFAPQQEATIRSLKGTVRGVKNRVRAGIATFTSDHRLLKLYAQREKGKLIIYVTTLGTIRETYERCLRLRKILWTLLIHFEERDVFMSRDVQIQLLDRLQTRKVTVPHVFLEGQYLGGVELIEKLNESGELRRLLQPYRRPASTTPCDTCGGFRMLPCSVCRGSKKSVHRNNFTLEFVALKCSACNESGLVSCQECAST